MSGSKISGALVIALALASRALGDAPEQAPSIRVTPSVVAAAYLEAIEIGSTDGRPPESETTVERRSDGVIRINLGLGESVSKRIVLVPKPGTTAEFMIEQQHQTSLTVMNEGPHMDLRDWRHHTSEWKPIEMSGPLVFVSRDTTSDEFPNVTTRQIVTAVEAQSRKWAAEGYFDVDRWVGLAKQCTSATSYPCGVSVSEVRLRIRVRDGGGWSTFQTIELAVPMGC